MVDSNYNIVEEVSLFIRHLQLKDFSLTTIESYCRDLKEFYSWLNQENIRFFEVKPRMMFSFIEYLDTKVGNNLRKSPATINRYLATLSSYFRFYENTLGFLESGMGNSKNTSPPVFESTVKINKVSTKQVSTSYFRRKETDKSRVKRLFPNEIECLYEAITAVRKDPGMRSRDKLMFRVIYETGIRIGECLGLYLTDIGQPDPLKEFGSIKVVKRNNNAYHIDHYAKTISRTIPVSMDLIFAIDDYICNDRPHLEEFQTLFVNHRSPKSGVYMTRRPVENFFEKLSEGSGIKCTPHKLRHTHGTELAEAGYNELYIANRLGHKSIHTTKKYVHLSLESQTDAYERFILSRKSVLLQ
ncbi:tyrosine-type recombinase/integrase [Paenibacillus sacheonensis]|uniref:Tyrosine-type recombinase/integrase n=1 Tax=Paenibacillus sacheonensis TaxID=742054 RepID=A0A7X4YQR0_9BACL|nr:tyrosine-type recombinase/integrase [Paenibacillus sacheonensis]NBC70811.1 tyrosine-type recombinase/integrase [Paenibacillus sacheonensis]